MKILRVFPCAIRASGNDWAISFFDSRGSHYSYEDGAFRLERYENQTIDGITHYLGRQLIVRSARNTPPSLSSAVMGSYIDVQSMEGEKVELSPLEKYALFFSFGHACKVPIFFKIENYPREEDITLVCIDMASGAVMNIPLPQDGKYIRLQEIDGDCYGVNGPRNAVIKYNKELEKLWEYEFDGQDPSTVKLLYGISYKDTVIYNLRMRQERRQRLDGEIFSFAKEDGAVRWTQKFLFQVEDCVLLPNERLAVLSNNELYILDANSGEILKSVNTGLAPQNCSAYLHASDTHLFVFSKKERIFQIYDFGAWQCLRTVNGAEMGLYFDRPGTIIIDYLFLPIRILEDNYYCGGYLIIDLKEVHLPIEFEKEPEFKITSPTPKNGSVTLAVEHDKLGDVLRLAEIYGLKYAALNGNSGDGLGGNPDFNGKIILRYGGCKDDRTDVLAKMDILKERFEYYAKEDRIRCGKKVNPVTFDYELF